AWALLMVVSKRFCRAPSWARWLSIIWIAPLSTWMDSWALLASRMLRLATLVSISMALIGLSADAAVRPRAARPVPWLPSPRVMSLSENSSMVPSAFLLTDTPVLAVLIEAMMESMSLPLVNLTSTSSMVMEVSWVSLGAVVPALRPSLSNAPELVVPLVPFFRVTAAPSAEVRTRRPSTVLAVTLVLAVSALIAVRMAVMSSPVARSISTPLTLI